LAVLEFKGLKPARQVPYQLSHTQPFVVVVVVVEIYFISEL
jgi:hypothetical protein